MQSKKYTSVEYYLDQGVRVLSVYWPLRAAIPAVCWLVGALMWHSWLLGVVRAVFQADTGALKVLTWIVHGLFFAWLFGLIFTHTQNWTRFWAWFGLSSPTIRKSTHPSSQTAMLRFSRWFWYLVTAVSGAYLIARGQLDPVRLGIAATAGLFMLMILLDRWRFIRKTKMPLFIGVTVAAVALRLIFLWVVATYAF